MPWQQIKVRVQEAAASDLEDALLELGAVSVTLQDGEDQPVFQVDLGSTPIWQNTLVVGLFEDDTPVDKIAFLIQKAGLAEAKDIHIETVEDTDWERVCMQDFKPMRFGERVWICPSWETPPQDDAVNIMLDPGLAFGTGTHPTTALCLEWLDQQNLQGLDVIDYGCGSGILAIAAALLGAKSVIAVDNDPQAITATQSNRDANRVSAEALQVYLPQDCPKAPADILVANILSGPLQELAPVLMALVKPGGKIVLSGVLSDQALELSKSYESLFTMLPPVVIDGWVRIEGTRLDEQ
ncbi:MAG: 50S ribosomal protein L11 methyltransferase [Pseudohongiellaceae bacterium]|nr:50S ribosomal protein L11 methyltransferase [Pseudohongiellaceae bacterium]